MNLLWNCTEPRNEQRAETFIGCCSLVKVLNLCPFEVPSFDSVYNPGTPLTAGQNNTSPDYSVGPCPVGIVAERVDSGGVPLHWHC